MGLRFCPHSLVLVNMLRNQEASMESQAMANDLQHVGKEK